MPVAIKRATSILEKISDEQENWTKKRFLHNLDCMKRERNLNKYAILLYNQHCNLYSTSSTNLTNGGVQDVGCNKPRQGNCVTQ